MAQIPGSPRQSDSSELATTTPPPSFDVFNSKRSIMADMSDKIKLLCWVQGDEPNHIFAIRVSLSDSVIELKEAIHKKMPSFQHINANSLRPWKVHLPIASINDDSRYHIKLEQGEQLISTMEISKIWEREPPKGIVSVIFPLPPGAAMTTSTRRKPTVKDHWSPRSDTVRRLFNILMRERLVYVRGTPGCGKTTLKELLHAHILEREPAASVYVKHSWPQDIAQSDKPLWTRLRQLDPAFPNPSVITFLLFDEGQDLYEDKSLWTDFFKGVQDRLYHEYRVILFCRYGSPSPRPVNHGIGVPLVLSNAARVSLRPTERSMGLLLNRLEFNEVVAQHERKLNMHPDLLDNIFNWTAGHVGAIVQLLHILSYQRVTEMPQGAQFTVDAFYAQNPPHLLFPRLRSGDFGRGLPLDKDLSEDPNVVAFFRILIRDGEVGEGAENSEAIHKCHRNGWVHSYETGPITHYNTHYIFASPLHSATVSWILAPSHDMLRPMERGCNQAT